MVRSVTVREPEFTAEDVALMLASRRADADMGPHGVPLWEAMDPANQFAFEGFEMPKTDWAEKAAEDAKVAYYKAYPDANRHGHRWGVRRRSSS